MIERTKKFFTLAEVMVAIVVLAAMVTAAVPLYNRATLQARNREAESMLYLIAQSEEMYGVEYRTYWSCPNTGQCNSDLDLTLSPTNWRFRVDVPGPGDYSVSADSVQPANPPNRTCTYTKNDFDSNTMPVCN